MKKVLSLTIAAVILLAAALSFASCGGSGEGIVGKWKTTIDYGKVMANTGEDITAMFDVSAFEGKTVDLTLDLASDNTYTVDFDKDQIKDVMLSVMEPMLNSMAESYGMSLDDVLAAQGVSSIEDMVDSLINGEDAEDSYHTTGNYTYKDGELTFADNVIKVELSGDTLKFTEIVTADGDENDSVFSDALLPLVFTRG